MRLRLRSLAWVAVAGLLAIPGVVLGSDIKTTRRADGTLVLSNDPRTPTRTVSRVPRRRAPNSELAPLIERYARARRLDPLLVGSVIQAESSYDVGAVSAKGAIGLMQLMPETARELGVDPWDPEQNVRGGTLYLRRLLDAFEGDLELALAGYNAGPNAVRRYSGIPPYQETIAYVGRVLSLYHGRPWTVTASQARPANGAKPMRPKPTRPVRVVRDGSGGRVFTTPQ